ncbi:protein SLOW GREEN 1, chloroplastic-like [Mercurialis annua]|uniref:protein SLOW GREEN 1, chloroplastic-like n=1 Tax=Mercurialis annua TaxID=3986 RepID=UPI0021603E2A|nr:protein SLOW GREEN 1, chloroplastic-like [Mercurialis annua]XP_050204139.1 protein SLOW GREEN 1, chloroplastic-like [Mercurialis annua]
MDSLAKLHCSHSPLHLSFNPNRPFFSKPIVSLPTIKTPSPPFKITSIKATSSSPPNPKPSLLQTLNPILKTTCITLTATAALFFFNKFRIQPAFAAVPVTSPPPIMEPVNEGSSSSPGSSFSNMSLEEQERVVEEQLARNPNNIDSLKSLMEVRIKSRKLVQAIEVVERLIELEPDEEEWPLLKAQIFSYSGDFDSARKEFEDILDKDPLRVEAYHGLVMAHAETGSSVDTVLKRIEFAMDKCKKEKKKSDLRDFKLLIAQIRVMEEKYVDALNVYEELVKEEPRDFRPYLCQGIIYTLLRKKEEAEKKFEQFRKLVPKNHPYREYFLDNMFATKFFSEKVQREGAGASG